ncbi:hypothetical protein [Roseibium sp.]|uniref:phage tail terminator protein n=1 Tax=Roseibium sp. TaxID=1936156 RepID=UPI00326712AE
MSLVPEIIARLKPVETPFKAVSGAADFALVEKRRLGSPAAFVMVAEEVAGDNERINGTVLQRLETDVAVVIVADNVSDARGGATADDIEDLKSFVRTQLIGFEPEAAEEPLTHISGKLLKARGGTVWFEDLYAAASYLEEQP